MNLNIITCNIVSYNNIMSYIIGYLFHLFIFIYLFIIINLNFNLYIAIVKIVNYIKANCIQKIIK